MEGVFLPAQDQVIAQEIISATGTIVSHPFAQQIPNVVTQANAKMENVYLIALVYDPINAIKIGV